MEVHGVCGKRDMGEGVVAKQQAVAWGLALRSDNAANSLSALQKERWSDR